MKKNGILNDQLSKLIAEMGHKDRLVISDAGLPIPEEPKRIDLALTREIPHFIEILNSVLTELVVEKAIIAKEMKTNSPQLYKKVKNNLKDIPIEFCSHEEFKKMTKESKGVVRSGEVIPFANIILIAGVDF